jgi:sugar/nucleoside kinase (ribokinase family)
MVNPRRLVSIGGIPVDIVVRGPGMPVHGGDMRTTAIVDRPGGPFSVLSAAARLGMAAVYAGGHGDGVRGTQVRAHLQADHIEVLRDVTIGRDTGFSLVLVDPAGERTCISAPGAEALDTEADVLVYEPQHGDAVHITGYDLADPAGEFLVERIGSFGSDILVIFDPGPLSASVPSGFAERLLHAAVKRADIITLNRAEALALTGHLEPAKVARDFPGKWIILRVGAEGAWLVRDGEEPWHAAPPQVTQRDSTGAGDTHTGAFVAGLAEGLQPRAALHLATVAAALSVRFDGPGTAPTRAEISAVLARRL